MAVRTDVTVDWTASPRIVTVASPSLEIVLQDLVDTLRVIEDDLFNLIYPKILDASGKQILTGGLQVGITVTLLDALLAFEARPGPSFVQASVSGGNLVAVDANSSPLATPIQPTAFVQVVIAASSSATLQNLTKLDELHEIAGLESGSPLTVSATQRAAAAITQAIAEAGGVVTVTRQ